MTLPTMAGGIDQGLLRAWCQAVDEGPFHALAVGERIGFDNLEMHTTLTFAAAATERVRLASTLTILPMYATAWAAKSLATLDVDHDEQRLHGGHLHLEGATPSRASRRASCSWDARAAPFKERPPS